LASAVIGALLVGKWIAAQIVGRAFAYPAVARMTMWSLTLPQVAATLAATLVAFDTRNPAGQRLIDNRLLNVVLVLMVTTSILGPVLTEHFAPRLLKRCNSTGSGEGRGNRLIPKMKQLLTYARQNERDYKTLVQAARQGRIEV
jgi:Kef-type K+ transport system membrane component KefB